MNLTSTRSARISNPDSRDIAPLIARVAIAALFIIAAYLKITAFARTTAGFERYGLPWPETTTVLVIVFEMVFGFLLIAGWQTKKIAWLLAAYTLVASFIGHKFWVADAAQYGNQLYHFLKNLCVIGGLIMVATFGPGRFAADSRKGAKGGDAV